MKIVHIFAQLKNVIAISFLTIFLSANTELHQFFKLPVLIHHFIEHNEEEQDISLFHFLGEHYGSYPDDSDNHHDHEKLPFKSNDCADLHQNGTFNHQFNFTFCLPNIATEKVSGSYHAMIYSSAIRDRIWQPPQFV